MRLATCVAQGILLIRLVRLGSPISITTIIDKHVLVCTYASCFVASLASPLVFRRVARWSRVTIYVIVCTRRRVNCKSSSSNKKKKNKRKVKALARFLERASLSLSLEIHLLSVISIDLLAKSRD